MAFKLTYLKEDVTYHYLRQKKVSNEHAEKIIKKVARHFKLGKISAEFRGQVDRGRAFSYREIIKMSWSPSLLIIAHELNHFLIWKRYPSKHVNHGSKKWLRSLKRVIDYCEKNDWWKDEMLKTEEQSRQTSERNLEREAHKKTPEYRLEQIQTAMKKWECKKNRAENALKKLERRRKIWKKKVKI